MTEQGNKNYTVQLSVICNIYTTKMTHKHDEDAGVYLAVDSVNLPVLVLQFWAHVNCHVAQVAYHRVHLPHVLLHLIFSSIIRDPRFEYCRQWFKSAIFLNIVHCLKNFSVPLLNNAWSYYFSIKAEPERLFRNFFL